MQAASYSCRRGGSNFGRLQASFCTQAQAPDITTASSRNTCGTWHADCHVSSMRSPQGDLQPDLKRLFNECMELSTTTINSCC